MQPGPPDHSIFLASLWLELVSLHRYTHHSELHSCPDHGMGVIGNRLSPFVLHNHESSVLGGVCLALLPITNSERRRSEAIEQYRYED